jgi:hypothetical protein
MLKARGSQQQMIAGLTKLQIYLIHSTLLY